MRALSSLLLFVALAMSVQANEIRFSVSSSGGMPLVDVTNEVLVGGIIKEFGEALAARLNATPVFVVLPRNRMKESLNSGATDMLCDMRPEWIDGGGWLWTEPIYSTGLIIVSRIDTPPIKSLSDLAGQRVGTILGYTYPALETALGAQFARDDATDNVLSLEKLLENRYQYAATNPLFFDYQRKTHPQGARLNPARFGLPTYDVYCALPAKGKFTLTQINNAIKALRKEGVLETILSHYRPK